MAERETARVLGLEWENPGRFCNDYLRNIFRGYIGIHIQAIEFAARKNLGHVFAKKPRLQKSGEDNLLSMPDLKYLDEATTLFAARCHTHPCVQAVRG